MAVYNIDGEVMPNIFRQNGIAINDAYDTLGNQVHGGSIPDEPYRTDRLLLFEDNFNADVPNNDVWTQQVGRPYGLPTEIYRAQNAYLENGKLVITEKREKHLDADWTHGGICTTGKKSWLFGRFEAKIKTAQFLNSAFWFIGNTHAVIYANDDGTTDYVRQSEGVEGNEGWSVCGEIDVLETPPTILKPQCGVFGANQSSIVYKVNHDIDMTKWHIYGMEWTDTYLSFDIDGVQYAKWMFSDYNDEDVAAYKKTPMAMFLAMGPWVQGDLDNLDSSITELKMYVDWVRVYAPTGLAEKIPDTSVYIQPTLRLRIGRAAYLVPEFTPTNTSDRTITWISEDDSICRCGNNSFVYGEQLGETNIYAITKNGHIAKCHVTVIGSDDPIIVL